ncbi:hypothetical protein NQ317_002435 [Molorchus minor]|uniref:Uncharacterized protein n=1 Tax=Molorchus minor TaxID=1323400 RepID=A0ABQ9IQH1_9CUCU|nr:hypothetical protein NQ317_002435 [Molorchus minor]
MKQKKIRIFISNTFTPTKNLKLMVLMDQARKGNEAQIFILLIILVIELDKELYGPDNYHLVEWHRTLTTQETDGFEFKKKFFFILQIVPVKRPGDKNVVAPYCFFSIINHYSLNLIQDWPAY